MQTLFVDFDGTICHDRFWRSLPSHEYERVQNFLFTTDNPLVADWMRGVYTAEAITKHVAEATMLPYEYLWSTFVHDCETMHVDHAILAAVAELRSAYHTVLITGNMDSFTRFTSPALALPTYFDVVVNSFDEGQLKTDLDGASFLKYVQGDIRDAILIEDSPKSCAIFTKLGGRAYQVLQKDDTLRFLNAIT